MLLDADRLEGQLTRWQLADLFLDLLRCNAGWDLCMISSIVIDVR